MNLSKKSTPKYFRFLHYFTVSTVSRAFKFSSSLKIQISYILICLLYGSACIYCLFSNKVLQITSGLEVLGKFRWELVACLIVAWILVYFSIWKSIKSSGKVIYITATLPYIIILAFLVRSVTLEGADIGLSYLFNPQWELLGDAKVGFLLELGSTRVLFFFCITNILLFNCFFL